jgi:hypothetical protein
LLADFGISSRIDACALAVEITGRHNLQVFRDQIGFSSGIQINEARKNGLWKHKTDKRALLNHALASYH